MSVSTAHRLLAMLVHRGFAEQRPDRSYEAGDVLRPATAAEAPVALLGRWPFRIWRRWPNGRRSR
ncbi:helix-turn-helix domain-containing protein [Streptomyces sp. NPDC020845]|uniref:helix-turn-helix domain-containing protein n=1 Tax=Streptomyces sp. NPDC020845 TaxID=3365096 RepID=UPI003796C3FD